MSTTTIILKKLALVAIPTLIALSFTIASAGNIRTCIEIWGKLYCDPPR